MPVTTRSCNGRGRGRGIKPVAQGAAQGALPRWPGKPFAQGAASPRWTGVATAPNPMVYGVDECGPGAITKEKAIPKTPKTVQRADMPTCPPKPKKIATTRARVPLEVMVSYRLSIGCLLLIKVCL